MRCSLIALFALLGCGGARVADRSATEAVTEAGVTEADVAEADVADAEAWEDEERSDPPTQPTVEALLAALAPSSGRPWVALSDAMDTCPAPRDQSDDAMLDWYGSCGIPQVAGWDARRRRWLVLDAAYSEGGLEAVTLVAASPTTDTVLLSSELGPDLISQLATRLRPHTVAAVNLITERADTTFSLSEFTVLVTLGGDLSGSHLYLETVVDLDHPQHVLWLLSPSGQRIELARQPARYTACDGDGWYCEATGAEGEDCTPEELRAEGRLCVEPWSIHGVAAEGGTLIVLGTRIVAGDGGYPAFHWVVRLP